MNSQDDTFSILIDDFTDHYILVFVLTSTLDNTRKCHYPELVLEPLSLCVSFIFPPEHVTEVNVSGERMTSIAVDKIGVAGKIT